MRISYSHDQHTDDGVCIESLLELGRGAVCAAASCYAHVQWWWATLSPGTAAASAANTAFWIHLRDKVLQSEGKPQGEGLVAANTIIYEDSHTVHGVRTSPQTSWITSMRLSLAVSSSVT